MADYLIKMGDTLSQIANKFGVSVQQLQQANGIKDANLIFAGNKLQVPDLESDNAFAIKGLNVEHNDTVGTSSTEERGADEQVTTTSTPTQTGNAGAEDPVTTTTTTTQTGNTGAAASGTLQSPVELSDALTVEEVASELHEKWVEGIENGKTNRLPALPGEVLEGDRDVFFSSPEVVCRDASGRTQNIEGKFDPLGDYGELCEKNPDAFTITDNSSGSDHKYLYRKIGVNEKGQPIYKCVSMNGDPITTDNQYTMEWTKDGVPEFVQYNDQDNYGVGLQVGKKQDDNAAADVDDNVSGNDVVDDGGQETAPGDGDGDVRVGDDRRTTVPGDGDADIVDDGRDDTVSNPGDQADNAVAEIWVNKMPGPKLPNVPDDINTFIQDVIHKCNQTSRPLSEAEQEQIRSCKSEQEVVQYLRSIGINVRAAV